MILRVVQARPADVRCLFLSVLAAEVHVGGSLQVVFFLLAAEILREDLDEMLETLSFA